MNTFLISPPPPTDSLAYWRDVVLSARAIYREMKPTIPEFRLWQLVYACERMGGNAPIMSRAVKRNDGFEYDGNIYLNPDGDYLYYLETIPHELTHRLAHEQRFDWLNRLIHAEGYDRTRFHEDVANRVGKLFLNAHNRRQAAERKAEARKKLVDVFTRDSVVDVIRRELEQTGVDVDSRQLRRILESL